jgi:hypothetical protein
MPIANSRGHQARRRRSSDNDRRLHPSQARPSWARTAVSSGQMVDRSIVGSFAGSRLLGLVPSLVLLAIILALLAVNS